MNGFVLSILSLPISRRWKNHSGCCGCVARRGRGAPGYLALEEGADSDRTRSPACKSIRGADHNRHPGEPNLGSVRNREGGLYARAAAQGTALPHHIERNVHVDYGGRKNGLCGRFQQRGLVWPVLLALLVFALGILLVPRVYFLRTNANFALFERNTASDQGNHELAKKKQAELNNFGDRISRLTQISLVCFGGGVFIVVIGAVLSLIFGEPYSAPSAPLSP